MFVFLDDNDSTSSKVIALHLFLFAMGSCDRDVIVEFLFFFQNTKVLVSLER